MHVFLWENNTDRPCPSSLFFAAEISHSRCPEISQISSFLARCWRTTWLNWPENGQESVLSGGWESLVDQPEDPGAVVPTASADGGEQGKGARKRAERESMYAIRSMAKNISLTSPAGWTKARSA